MGIPIVLVGLGAQYPNPGTFVELDFARGPVAGSGALRAALIMGNKTAAGSATPDTVVYGPDTAVTCLTETDVIALFGSGSQIHRAFLRFTAVNPITPLYFLAVTESAGTAATATATIATTAASNGNIRTWVGAEFVDTPISNGDTVTTIATNVCQSITNNPRWQVTAANVAGVITFTHKNKGPEGNWLRIQQQITPAVGTIATTTSLTANTFMSGGATPDSNVAALATILASKFYYIISCDSDSTNVGRIASQIGSQALPTTGIRQRLICGSVDSVGNVNTFANTINNPRAEVVHGVALDYAPLELAANNAALYALLETGAPIGVARKNFSLFPTNPTDQASWVLKQGRNGVGASPTATQIALMLNNGVTPVINVYGGTQLVKRCTTYSLNGGASDYRIRDAHKVTICDYWCDDVTAVTQLQFGGKDLLPDPLPGQPPPPPTATFPRAWGTALKRVTSDYGNAGQWSYPPGIPVQAGQTPADVINSNAVIQAETNPPTRMSALFGLSPVNIADQFAILAQQVG